MEIGEPFERIAARDQDGARLNWYLASADGRLSVRIATRLMIGSEEDCDLRLQENGIAERHALLFVDEEGLWLEDLGAPAGTFVNGERVREPVPLHRHDQFRLAGTEFEVDADVDKALAAASEPIAQMPEPDFDGPRLDTGDFDPGGFDSGEHAPAAPGSDAGDRPRFDTDPFGTQLRRAEPADSDEFGLPRLDTAEYEPPHLDTPPYGTAPVEGSHFDTPRADIPRVDPPGLETRRRIITPPPRAAAAPLARPQPALAGTRPRRPADRGGMLLPVALAAGLILTGAIVGPPDALRTVLDGMPAPSPDTPIVDTQDPEPTPIVDTQDTRVVDTQDPEGGVVGTQDSELSGERIVDAGVVDTQDPESVVDAGVVDTQDPEPVVDERIVDTQEQAIVDTHEPPQPFMDVQDSDVVDVQESQADVVDVQESQASPGPPVVGSESAPLSEDATATVADGPPPPGLALTPAIEQHLALAQRAFDRNSIMTPPEDSAVYHLERVLSQDPNNPVALDLLDRCAEELAQAAADAYADGRQGAAQRFLDEALRIDPSDPLLLAIERTWRGG